MFIAQSDEALKSLLYFFSPKMSAQSSHTTMCSNVFKLWVKDNSDTKRRPDHSKSLCVYRHHCVWLICQNVTEGKSNLLQWKGAENLGTKLRTYAGKSVAHFKPTICITQVRRWTLLGHSPSSSFLRFLLTGGSTFSGQPAQAWRGICQRSGLNPSRPYSHPPGSVVWESASVYAGLVSRQVCSCLSYWQC